MNKHSSSLNPKWVNLFFVWLLSIISRTKFVERPCFDLRQYFQRIHLLEILYHYRYIEMPPPILRLAVKEYSKKEIQFED